MNSDDADEGANDGDEAVEAEEGLDAEADERYRETVLRGDPHAVALQCLQIRAHVRRHDTRLYARGVPRLDEIEWGDGPALVFNRPCAPPDHRGVPAELTLPHRDGHADVRAIEAAVRGWTANVRGCVPVGIVADARRPPGWRLLAEAAQGIVAAAPREAVEPRDSDSPARPLTWLWFRGEVAEP